MLDTALALQLRRAGAPIVAGRARARALALAERAREFADTLCVGRTHGVHAEPTTFGLKLAGYAFEAHRNAERLERAFAQAAVGAISGAVGTYSAHEPGYEARVLERLGAARARTVSTQVVPRDRHAELLQAIALAGAGLERFATEIRHLQRTEVREVEEPFRAGQKGSSAMPHKRNPITTERITGLARVLRGYSQAGLENVALWHERDISHSGAERVILPDATILLDYMQRLALRVARGMTVHADRMARNLEHHLRRAVLPDRAARARRGRDDARRGVPDRAATRAAGVGHADAAARPARRSRTSGSTSTRSSTTRASPATSPSCWRGSTRSTCRHEPRCSCARRPATSADLFHALPLDILDPFLYAEHDGRKVAVTGVLERDRIEALGLGIEVLDPFSLGPRRAARARASASSTREIEIDLRACQRARARVARSCRPTSRSRGPTSCAARASSCDVDAEAFDLRRRAQDRRAARRHPARAGGGRRRDGRRGGAAARAAAPGSRASRCASACRRSARSTAAELPDDRDRRPRRAVGRPATRRATAPIERGGIVARSTSGRATARRAAGRT